jgi:hypothetical protein
MSLAGITSLASTPAAGSSEFNTIRKQDSNQLFSALENGDLSGAQAAYSKLAALNNKGSGGPYIGPKLSSDFAAIGQALQNGDLTGAQEASLQFGQDLLAANEKLHGGNPQPTPPAVVNLSGLIDEVNPKNVNSTPVAATPSTNSTTPTPVASTTGSTPTSSSIASTSATGTTPEIVINLGGTNGPTLDLNVGGSQIEISLAGASGATNSPSTIDLNFGGTTNASPIELTLGNSNSSNPAQSIGISILA